MTLDFSPAGGIWALGAAWAAGVLTSFTPCVYPLLPVVAAYFSRQQSQSLRGRVVLAVAYVLGTTATFVLLGVIAAKSGTLFGGILGDPRLLAAIALVFFLLALFTLDLITIPALSAIQTKASRVQGSGPVGAFLMGAVSGLVAAPCVGPALAAILLVAARSQNTGWGALLLAAYALGFCGLFFVVAIASSVTGLLPRSGRWLAGVKFVFGVLLLVAVLYLLSPLIGAVEMFGNKWILLGTSSVAIVLVGLTTIKESKIIRALAAFAAAGVIYYGILAQLTGTGANPTPLSASESNVELVWHDNWNAALKIAKQNNTLIMVDFTAKWCVACLEFEHKTFPDSRVKELLSKLTLLRFDMTNYGAASPEVRELLKVHQVVGLPAILFLTAAGEEVPESRISGFLGPAEFVAKIESIRPT